VFGGGKKFMDTVMWDNSGEHGVCLRVRKVSHPDRNYELQVSRYLEDNGQTIKCVAAFVPLKMPGKKRVEAVSYFTKTGPSPNTRPEPVADDNSDDGTGTLNTQAGKVDDNGHGIPVTGYSPAPNVVSEEEYAPAHVSPASRARSMSINNYRDRVNSRMRQRSNSRAYGQHVPRDFSGVWNRTRTVNFEAFIGTSWVFYAAVLACYRVDRLKCDVF
jgi:hypothetical protein